MGRVCVLSLSADLCGMPARSRWSVPSLSVSAVQTNTYTRKEKVLLSPQQTTLPTIPWSGKHQINWRLWEGRKNKAVVQLKSRAVKMSWITGSFKEIKPKNDSVFLELLESASWGKIADDFSSGLKNNWIGFIFGVEPWNEVTCWHASQHNGSNNISVIEWH